MKNQILVRRASLRATIATLDYKIANLQKFFSEVQVEHWKKMRDTFQRDMDALPTEQQIQEGVKRINFSNTMAISPMAIFLLFVLGEIALLFICGWLLFRFVRFVDKKELQQMKMKRCCNCGTICEVNSFECDLCGWEFGFSTHSEDSVTADSTREKLRNL
jgi:hypothetical protein